MSIDNIEHGISHLPLTLLQIAEQEWITDEETEEVGTRHEPGSIH